MSYRCRFRLPTAMSVCSALAPKSAAAVGTTAASGAAPCAVGLASASSARGASSAGAAAAAADALLLLPAADHRRPEAAPPAPVEFLLCIGDDDSDGFMPSATTARACAPGLRERLQTRLFTVSVGTRPSSHAQYVASDASQVLALLEFLREDSH